MKKLLITGAAGLLLHGAPALAQNDLTPAAVRPTKLPGEEKLSGQERAERDFLMPVRRKQAAALKLAAQEEATIQTAAEMTARSPEVLEEANAPEAAETHKVPATAPRHTYHRRPSSVSRHRTTASRKKVVHKSTSGKRKATVTRRRSRR